MISRIKKLRAWFHKESFKEMIARHEREVELFQSHCPHHNPVFTHVPFVVCAVCTKFIRVATPEEIEQMEQDTKGRLFRDLDEEDIACMDGPEMAVAAFRTDGGRRI